MDLYLILKICLIVFGLFSLIGYKFDQSENKQNLDELIDNHIAIRELEAEEIILLEPYLNKTLPVFPYQPQSSLINVNISEIAGTCSRHSLQTDSDETSYYYEINGIEVFFPYKMERYLAQTNVAEVVFTESFAFVVKINGYDLKTAAESINDEIERQEYWQTGQSKSFNNFEHEGINYANPSLSASEKHKKFDYEIVEQREETPLESAIRNKNNTGWLTVLFLILAVFSFVWYWYCDKANMIILIIIFLLLAFFCSWRKPKSKIYNVNRIRGTIDSNNCLNREIVIGDTLFLKYPMNWIYFLPENTTSDVEMDVSVDDNKLLRYGYTLSISREVEQFGPPKFLKRNFLLFFTGLILSGVVFYVSSIMDNALFAYQIVNQTVNTINIDDVTSLKNSSLQKGDLVNIQLNGASCDVISSEEDDKCQKIIINSQPTTSPNFSFQEIPNWIIDLFDSNLIETKRDRTVEYAEMRLKSELKLMNDLYRTHGNYNRYRENVELTKLLHVGHLITVVDESCKESDIDECKFVKRFLLKLLTSSQALTEENWSDLVEYGKKSPEHEEIIVVYESNDLISGIKELRTMLLNQQIDLLKYVVTNYQKNESRFSLTIVNNQDAEIVKVNTDINHIRKEILPLVDYYNILSGKGGSINITGLVTEFDFHNDNSIANLTINADPHYSMDKEELTSFTSPIIIDVVFFALMVLITLWNGLMLCWKLIANRRRHKKIINNYANLII